MHYGFLNPFTAAKVLSLKADHIKWTQLSKKDRSRPKTAVVCSLRNDKVSFPAVAWFFVEWRGDGEFSMCDGSQTKQLFRPAGSSSSQHLAPTTPPAWDLLRFLQVATRAEVENVHFPPRVRGLGFSVTQPCELFVCFHVNQIYQWLLPIDLVLSGICRHRLRVELFLWIHLMHAYRGFITFYLYLVTTKCPIMKRSCVVYSLSLLITYDKPDVTFPGILSWALSFSHSTPSLTVFTQFQVSDDPPDTDKFLQFLIPSQDSCLCLYSCIQGSHGHFHLKVSLTFLSILYNML